MDPIYMVFIIFSSILLLYCIANICCIFENCYLWYRHRQENRQYENRQYENVV